MNHEETLERLGRQVVVPVLRSDTAARAAERARALASAGLEAVELTLSTPDVLAAIRDLAADGLTVGLGTVTSADQIAPAVAAGASFVVSYAQPPAFVATARRLGVPAVPGAFTPSEVLAARAAGAPAVKLFPAGRVGPAYLRDLLAVMPGLRLMATGGIAADVAELARWRAAGAWCVGLGRELERQAASDPDRLRSLVCAVQGAPAAAAGSRLSSSTHHERTSPGPS